MSKIKSGQDLIDLYDAMDDERKKSLGDFDISTMLQIQRFITFMRTSHAPLNIHLKY